MKTLYVTLLSGFLMATAGKAQITLLNVWHEPQDGNQHGVRLYDSTGAIPKTTGMGQAWDFSQMVMQSTPASVVNFMAAASVPSASLFTGATVVGDHGSNSYSYYKTSASQLEMLGTWSSTGTTMYSDSRKEMIWPTTSGTTYTDTFAATKSTSTMTTSITGSLTSLASGFGMLELPGGAIFDSVLQIRYDKMTMLGDTGAAPNNTTMISTVYKYISGKQRFPLVTVTYNSWSDTTNTMMKNYMVEINYLVAVGINDYNFDAGFAIYPNPAKTQINFSLSNPQFEQCEVHIYNMTGQEVKQVNLGNSATIAENVNIEGIQAGIYVVRTHLGNKTSVRKLIVE